MIANIRHTFNDNFTKEKYQQYIDFFAQFHTDPIPFRIAETPIFVPNSFKTKMLETADFIVDCILSKGFKAATQSAIPDFLHYQNEGQHPHFIAFDFGICKNPLSGEFEPQLIEMQGFPSLFFYQFYQDQAARNAYNISEDYQIYLNNYSQKSTTELLKNVIIGNENPENVILLELFPEKQKTKIDFFFTRENVGIETICLTKIRIKDGYLFYEKNGKEIPIKRIYNRLIWDDVVRNGDNFIQQQAKIIISNEHIDWVTHPSWFYRISKYTLPFLQHPNIPTTYFLNAFNDCPDDIGDYVIKPLFSYAGKGVIIHPTIDDFYAIEDPNQYILQKRVQYEAAINTPDVPAKAEIRLFYIWNNDMSRPVATHNLARLTKEEMIGVDYNSGNTWIGGSFAYFEKK